MKKSFTYVVKLDVEYEKVKFKDSDKEYYVYRETKTGPGRIFIKEGICEPSQIDNYVENRGIENVNLLLLDNKAEVAFKTYLNSEKEWEPHNYLIKKPYTYICENGTESISLYQFDLGSDSLYDINGEVLPRAIFFNFSSSNGSMHNGRFNLNKVLDKIKDNADIRFLKECDKNIDSIPYWAAVEGYNEFLKFIFMPTKEQYKYIFDNKKSLINPIELVIDEYLNLKDCRVSNIKEKGRGL